MSLSLDPTDFPLYEPPGLGLAVQLLPVTRVQFEYFLGDAPGRRKLELDRYQDMLAVSARGNWRTAVDVSESLFATAILPAEVEAYASWLGQGFRLPTDREWKAIDAAAQEVIEPTRLEELKISASIHPAAQSILSRTTNTSNHLSYRQAGLFEQGLLEWVQARDGYRLQGRVRPGLYRIIHNPQVHDAIRIQVEPLPRHRAFGFRLVKKTAGGARK